MSKTEIKNSDLCSLSVTSVIKSVSNLIAKANENHILFKNLPAVMLWGMPGVGKSQAVKAIAEEVQKLTGKRTRTIDVRLLLFNPIDLRGIPIADVTKSFAIWLKPKIFDMNESNDVINFLFLDEISAAPPSVQAAAYQITLDRVIGEHKLPDNCFVIAAGNRVTDRSVAYKMPKALANRLCHFVVESDFVGWKNWATEKGLDHRVVGFLSKRTDLLSTFDAGNDEVAFATPRSWEMVSNILLAGNYSNLDNCYPLIAGLVGQGTATEFVAWCKNNIYIPDITDIISGKANRVPNTTDSIYATIRIMLNYITAHKSNVKEVENCISYSKHFTPDMTAYFFKELILMDIEIAKRRSISDWIKVHAKYFT